MSVGVPRWIIVGIAALFSAYVVVLGIYDLDRVRVPYPAIVAMVLFAAVVALSLLPLGPNRMPIWLAALCLSTLAAVTLLVSSQVDLADPNGPGYATWYVAGAGALMTIVCTPERRDMLADVVFRETTTIGIRYQEMSRLCLDREIQPVDTAYGVVRFKVARKDGAVVNAQPEFEDLVRLAAEQGVPIKMVQAAAQKAWLDRG